MLDQPCDATGKENAAAICAALKVYRNDTVDWVIAVDPEDASALAAEYWNGGPDDPDEWEECSLDTEWTCNEAADQLDGPVTLTFREWVARKGRCFLGSTEY